jgi:hypothetical protein
MDSDTDWCNAVTVDIIRQTAMLFHRQIPRCPDLRAGIWVCAGGDLRTKAPQYKAAPPMDDFGAESIERNPDDAPQHPRNPILEGDVSWAKWKGTSQSGKP